MRQRQGRGRPGGRLRRRTGTNSSRRHPRQVYVPRSKDGVFGAQSKSFYFRVAKAWNQRTMERGDADKAKKGGRSDKFHQGVRKVNVQNGIIMD